MCLFVSVRIVLWYDRGGGSKLPKDSYSGDVRSQLADGERQDDGC